MTPTVALRPATLADHDAIAVIWHEGWRDGHLGHVPAELMAHRGLAQFCRRVESRLPATIVAELDGVVVGFVIVDRDEVEQVYVAASARGTPVASMLLAAGERVVGAEYADAWLAVVAGNARARRFYEREGWLDDGPIDYVAETLDGTFVVPSRRYLERVSLNPRSGRP